MSDVNFRRTWSKDGNSKSSSSSTTSNNRATRQASSYAPLSTDLPKLLEARTSKVKFDAIVGKTQMVMAGTGAGAQAGFYCSLCDKLCKDNVAFLDHLNSPLHARNTGHKMEIKRASVENVRERIEYHKRKRLETQEEYDLEKRVTLLKAQSELERKKKREAKKEAKLRRSGRREDPTTLDPDLGEDATKEEEDDDEASEYSDYDIDEYGNIIETPKTPSKKKEKKGIQHKDEVEEKRKQAEAKERKDENQRLAELMGFQAFGSSRK